LQRNWLHRQKTEAFQIRESIPAGESFCFVKETGLVAFKDVTEDGKLVVKVNGGRIAISVYDAKSLEGYQIKGVAEYVTEGAVVDTFKAMVEKMFNGAATAKGALVITPEKVIVTTPGADNKKVL